MVVVCQRCGVNIPSLNKLRKWCVDCRLELTNERARDRNRVRRANGGNVSRVLE